MRNFKAINLIIFAMVLLLTLFCSSSVYADDTSLGRTPNGVFPLQENNVIMESEEIIVDLETNTVECIFIFHNTGKSNEVLMGFPGKLYHEEDGLTNDANLEINNFKAYVKGKELNVIREQATKLNTNTSNVKTLEPLNYSEYFTFTVPFKEDEKITVRNTYDFIPTFASMGYITSGYVLKTGAMWKGPIGSAKVIFKLGSIQPYEISRLTSGFKFVKNELIWERNNFEPKYDLQIVYNTYQYSTDFIENQLDGEDKLKEEIKQTIDSYDKIKELANKNKIDELLTLYNKAVEERDSILALYIRSCLPSNILSDDVTSIGKISIRKGNNGESINYYAECEVLGPEAADIQISISHIENGVEIQDEPGESVDAYYLGSLAPGIYTITYKVTDWLDQTQQKSIQCKISESGEVFTENEPQFSASDIIPSTSTSADLSIQPGRQPTNANESINNSANKVQNGTEVVAVNASIDNPSNSEANSYIKKVIIVIISGIVLLGLIAILVIIIRKRDRNTKG